MIQYLNNIETRWQKSEWHIIFYLTILATLALM